MTIYLVDKSAWAQRDSHPAIARQLLDLVVHGNLACCEIVALELLYSARNAANYTEISDELHSLRWLEVDTAVMVRAIEIQGELAKKGQHRRPIPDLIVAACAERHNATVLHHDRDFDIIAAVTGQPVADIIALWGEPDANTS